MKPVTVAILDLARLWLSRPVWGKIVVALITISGPLLLIAFAGDSTVRISGDIRGIDFDLKYETREQLILPLLVFGCMIALVVWMYNRAQFPPVAKSQRIAELENMFTIQGAVDSVRQKFLEVYDVNVSIPELSHLMQSDERSELAHSLKRARSHIAFDATSGFHLLSPSFPYKLAIVLTTTTYALAFGGAMFFFVATIGAVVTGVTQALTILAGGTFVCGAVSWISLQAYSACFHARRLVAT